MAIHSGLRGWTAVGLALILVGCRLTGEVVPASEAKRGAEAMNEIAESYVKLVLDLGAHDPDFVDAYYGPPEWRESVATRGRSGEDVATAASSLATALARVDVHGLDEMERLRHRYLTKQIAAVRARAAMLGGRRFSFDEESEALYDARAPHYDAAHFEAILEKLDRLLPGEGSRIERYEAFKSAFVIPTDRVDAVFRAAIDECRRRTLDRTELPPNENFRVEYVTGKSWSAYNWYQGDAYSLIQVNVDLPISIDRAIDLACHEGYPGHHVYNALLEKNLVRDRGWVEFSVYPLFSPQSLIAEGTANYGIDLAFPGDERTRFESEVLFPLAGLDPSQAERFYEVWNLTKQLSYAGNEAARAYCNGTWTEEQAIDWLERYALMPRGMAERRIRFIEQYRSYVINYNLGQDRVAEYIDRCVGPNGSQDDRWREFLALLASPRLPSGLLESHD